MLIDRGNELAWNDPRTELERWEYGRFGYNRPTANVNEMLVSDPLGRMHDGLFLGLRHLSTSAGRNTTVHLKYRFEFYRKADVPWLSANTSSLVVPAGGAASFNGTIQVPRSMPPGDYSAAFEVEDPGTQSYSDHTTIIPVTMNVAADFSSGVATLGGQTSYAYDQNQPYNNGAVRGHFDWGWREESGDWRAFYLNINNDPLQEAQLYSQNFDAAGSLPADWSVTDVNGTAGDWIVWNGTHYPSGHAAHSAPNLVYFNSYSVGTTNRARLWHNVPISFSTAATPAVKFWMYHDTGYSSSNDTVQVQVSTDGGASWSNVGEAFARYQPGSNAWREHIVYLTDYVGQSSVLVGFLGSSGYGNDCHLDDIRVVDYVYPFPVDAHVIVKDEWADVAPHTDIDTVVLGPQASASPRWASAAGPEIGLSQPTSDRTRWMLSGGAPMCAQVARCGTSTPPPAPTRIGSPSRSTQAFRRKAAACSS